jgi:hypothetical protein
VTKRPNILLTTTPGNTGNGVVDIALPQWADLWAIDFISFLFTTGVTVADRKIAVAAIHGVVNTYVLAKMAGVQAASLQRIYTFSKSGLAEQNAGGTAPEVYHVPLVHHLVQGGWTLRISPADGGLAEDTLGDVQLQLRPIRFADVMNRQTREA